MLTLAVSTPLPLSSETTEMLGRMAAMVLLGSGVLLMILGATVSIETRFPAWISRCVPPMRNWPITVPPVTARFCPAGTVQLPT